MSSPSVPRRATSATISASRTSLNALRFLSLPFLAALVASKDSQSLGYQERLKLGGAGVGFGSGEGAVWGGTG
jgi:hypothetical protein